MENGQVIAARPVDVQADGPQGGDDVVAVFDLALFDLGGQIVVDGGLGLGPLIGFALLTPANQPSLMEVGAVWGKEPSAGRVIGAGPIFPQVVEVTQRVESFLPTGRKGVHGFACGELNSWYDEVQLMVSGMTVAYPQNVILVWLQSRKGGAFEVVHQAFFLFRRNLVLRSPGANPGRELPFSGLRVNQVTGQIRVSAQNFRR